MVPTNTSPRRFRLQFSLRGMLLAMLLVGVAITVYRWPWEKTQSYYYDNGSDERQPQWYMFRDQVDPALTARFQHLVPAERVTTYRRDWLGKPVAHGLQREFIAGQLMEEVALRDDVRNGPSRCFNGLGQLTEEAHFRGGKLHGPFRIGDGTTWTHVGQYAHDEKLGAWQVLENRQTGPSLTWLLQTGPTDCSVCERPTEWDRVPDHAIRVQQHWRQGLRHGHWEWRTLSGELLNTAEYEADELTHWNGQAVQPWLVAMLQDCAGDPELVRTLQSPATLLATSQHSHSLQRMLGRVWGVKDDWLDLDSYSAAPSPRNCCLVHYDPPRRDAPLVSSHATVGMNLLETALLQGLVPQFRYGGLWFVPASEISGPFRDPTGIDRIQFEPGSSQAIDWETPIELRSDQSADGSMAWLLYVLKGSSIGLNTGALPLHDPLVLETKKYSVLRKRRDVFGHFLCRAGLRCEQQGNTIVIKRHWTGLESFRRFEGSNYPSWRTSPLPEEQLLD